MASELRVDKIVPTDGAPTGGGGGIVQVKQFTLTNSANGGFFIQTSSSTWTASPLLLAITPKFSTSKILINVNSSSYNAGNGHTPYTIYRDSTNIGGATYGMADFTGAHTWTPFSMMFLDSPATTSSITYALQGLRGSAGTFYFGRNDTDSDAAETGRCPTIITAKEVAA